MLTGGGVPENHRGPLRIPQGPVRSEGASSRGEQPPTGRIDRLVLRKETSSLPAHEAPCPVSPNTPARLALPARPAPVRGLRRPSALTSLPRSRSSHRASCRTVPPALVRGTSPVCILKPCSGRRFCGPLPPGAEAAHLPADLSGAELTTQIWFRFQEETHAPHGLLLLI